MTLRTHLSFPVKDLERSLAFYETLFGRGPDKVREGYANWRLDEPGLMLALVHTPEHEAQGAGVQPEKDAGIAHFGVELDDLEALAARRGRLEEAGEPAVVEADAVCCYATAEKVWTWDPDGRPWELWVKTGEADVMHKTDDTCCTPEAAQQARAAVTASSEKAGGGCCG